MLNFRVRKKKQQKQEKKTLTLIFTQELDFDLNNSFEDCNAAFLNNLHQISWWNIAK